MIQSAKARSRPETTRPDPTAPEDCQNCQMTAGTQRSHKVPEVVQDLAGQCHAMQNNSSNNHDDMNNNKNNNINNIGVPVVRSCQVLDRRAYTLVLRANMH